MHCWEACGDPQIQGVVIANAYNLKFFWATNKLNHNQLLFLKWEKEYISKSHIKYKKVWSLLFPDIFKIAFLV